MSMASPPQKHFKIMTNEELKVKQADLEHKNSLKSECHVDRAFRKFLRQANGSEEYQFLKNWN